MLVSYYSYMWVSALLGCVEFWRCGFKFWCLAGTIGFAGFVTDLCAVRIKSMVFIILLYCAYWAFWVLIYSVNGGHVALCEQYYSCVLRRFVCVISAWICLMVKWLFVYGQQWSVLLTIFYHFLFILFCTLSLRCYDLVICFRFYMSTASLRWFLSD